MTRAGAVVISGHSNSFDLPTTQGAYDRTVAITSGLLFFDAYVARLSPDGARLLYGTYLGGGFNDEHTHLALTGPDTAVVSGWTKSHDFPVRPTAFDTVLNNDGAGGAAAPFDGFLARLTLLADGDGDDTVSAPALLAPAGGAQVTVNDLVTFDWSDVSDTSGMDAYHVQINRSPDFVCCNDWIEVWSTDSEHVDSVRFDGPYYWRVQTADRSGNLSAWSEVRTFNAGTPPPPAAPALNQPRERHPPAAQHQHHLRVERRGGRRHLRDSDRRFEQLQRAARRFRFGTRADAVRAFVLQRAAPLVARARAQLAGHRGVLVRGSQLRGQARRTAAATAAIAYTDADADPNTAATDADAHASAADTDPDACADADPDTDASAARRAVVAHA